MRRSPIVAVVAVVLIIASIIWLTVRPRSHGDRAQHEAGWRKCAECGHVWHMEISEIVKQQKEHGKLVKCPKCGARAGMATMVCPKCGERLTVVDEKTGAYPPHSCPYCGVVFSEFSGSGGEGPQVDFRSWEKPGAGTE